MGKRNLRNLRQKRLDSCLNNGWHYIVFKRRNTGCQSMGKKHGFPNENRKGGTEMKKLLIILIALVATLFFTSLTMARDRGGGHRGNYPGGGRLNNDHGFRGGGNFDRGSIDRGHFRGGYDHFRGGHYPGYYGGYYGGWSGWDDYGYYGNYGYWVPGYWIRQWDPYYGRWVRIWIPGYWR
jgi:hypothetical protein